MTDIRSYYERIVQPASFAILDLFMILILVFLVVVSSIGIYLSMTGLNDRNNIKQPLTIVKDAECSEYCPNCGFCIRKANK